METVMKDRSGFKSSVLVIALSLLFLMGCASNASAKFKEAGCKAADQNAYDEAAIQFRLAADNGDPGAVVAAIASQQIWGTWMAAANGQYTEGALDGASDPIAAFCGSGYDID